MTPKAIVMAESAKIIRLACPICETRLKIGSESDRFACLQCGTELQVVRGANVVRLEPTPEAADEMSDAERELAAVQAEIKQRDDSYGVGCAVSTVSIMLVACVGGILSTFLRNSLLFAIIVGIAVVLLAVVLFFFVGASAYGARELARRRTALVARVAQEKGETA